MFFQLRSLSRSLGSGFAALVLLTASARAGIGVTTLARLGGDPDGYHPRAALVDGLDGNFYGTTEAGGPGNLGTIYKIAPDGTFATIYVFPGGSDGSNPVAGLARGGDGNLYGTTGGTFPLNSGKSGTIFRVTPTGAFTTVYRFTALDASNHNADGGFPVAGLTPGSDGSLYGTAQYGGSSGGGTAFRLTTGGVFTTLGSFDATSLANAYGPTTALVEGDSGNFYGTTRTSGAASEGTFYRVTPGVGIATLHSFDGGTDGGFPDTALVRAADGNFYGSTQAGTLYQVTAVGAVTTIHQLVTATEGANPSALVLGAAGNLFGTTNSRGPNGNGTFFQVTTAGALTVLTGLTDGGKLGYVPNALVAGGDGNFYAAMVDTGNGGAGSVFRITPAGAQTALHLFYAGGSDSVAKLLQMPNGNFYGVTVKGGATNGGTVFGFTSAGVIATQYSFGANDGGSAPAGGLFLTADGSLRGTLSQGFIPAGNSGTTSGLQAHPDAAGGLGAGGLMRLIIDQAIDFTLRTVADVPDSEPLPPVCGDSPLADLTGLPIGGNKAAGQTNAADTTLLYGVTASGSDDNFGAVYSVSSDLQTFTKLHAFTNMAGDGAEPQAGVVVGTDGNLYGTTLYGGTHGLGTVFVVTPAGALTTLYSFAGTGDGASPVGALVLGSDGNFYGTTKFSSSLTGTGTVFKITPSGGLTTLHAFADDGSEGSQSKAGLFLASDGNFYGTTSSGGDGSAGTVFSITPGGTLTKLHDFGAASGDGKSPAAPLIQGADGNLYGTTQYGGTDDCGVVFKVDLNAAASVVPTVTAVVTTPAAHTATGERGVVTLTLSEAQTTDIVVHYLVKGSGVNGTDYVHLKGTAKIKAGKTSKPIKVEPLGDLGGAARKTAVIVLSPDSAYTVGTAGKLKVKIFNP